MPDKEKHERICRLILGNAYTEVHEWLDESYSLSKTMLFSTWTGMRSDSKKHGTRNTAMNHPPRQDNGPAGSRL